MKSELNRKDSDLANNQGETEKRRRNIEKETNRKIRTKR